MPDSQVPGVFWLTVSQVTARVKEALECSLDEVWVQGEVSSVKLHQPSGHLYFSLKDDACLIRAVMFRRHASGLSSVPEDGEMVIIHGRITVFERQGQYELVVDDLVPAGARGVAALRLEMLKNKLAAEGIFDAGRKRSLPRVPAVVGVVTSNTGAALADIIKVASKRWPAVRIVVSPATVQGEDAPQSIVAAIGRLNESGLADVMIVGRGGGAREDLSCFNDEGVVRAIVGSRIPVVSAVGHEIDMTLADLAADARAPTPSAAAEMTVPERRELTAQVESLALRAERAISASVMMLTEQTRRLATSHGLRSPEGLVQQRAVRLDDLGARLRIASATILSLQQRHIQAQTERMGALNPRAVLARGYALCLDHATRSLVPGARIITEKQMLDIVFHDGEATCQVTRSTPNA